MRPHAPASTRRPWLDLHSIYLSCLFFSVSLILAQLDGLTCAPICIAGVLEYDLWSYKRVSCVYVQIWTDLMWNMDECLSGILHKDVDSDNDFHYYYYY